MTDGLSLLDNINAHGTVNVLEKETPFQGYFRIDRYTFRHSLFTGGMSEAFTREIFERGHAAAVLPYDVKNDRVLLIEQFRPGAYAAGMAPWLIEVVAGIIDGGETAETVALREAQEESGSSLGRLEEIGTFLMTPGGSSETIALFAGELLTWQDDVIYGLDHEHEDIRAFFVSSEEAFALLKAGKITNAITVIALQWLQLNREDLRTKWS